LSEVRKVRVLSPSSISGTALDSGATAPIHCAGDETPLRDRRPL